MHELTRLRFPPSIPVRSVLDCNGSKAKLDSVNPFSQVTAPCVRTLRTSTFLKSCRRSGREPLHEADSRLVIEPYRPHRRKAQALRRPRRRSLPRVPSDGKHSSWPVRTRFPSFRVDSGAHDDRVPHPRIATTSWRDLQAPAAPRPLYRSHCCVGPETSSSRNYGCVQWREATHGKTPGDRRAGMTAAPGRLPGRSPERGRLHPRQPLPGDADNRQLTAGRA
jgi:hypothetical protein